MYEYELDREIEREREREYVIFTRGPLGTLHYKKGRKNNKIKRGQRNSGNQSERSKMKGADWLKPPALSLSTH